MFLPRDIARDPATARVGSTTEPPATSPSEPPDYRYRRHSLKLIVRTRVALKVSRLIAKLNTKRTLKFTEFQSVIHFIGTGVKAISKLLTKSNSKLRVHRDLFNRLLWISKFSRNFINFELKTLASTTSKANKLSTIIIFHFNSTTRLQVTN